MPVIQDPELLYTLLSEGKLDLMYLPAGAIAWLWKDGRPEEQVEAATKLAVAAKDINPIVNASVLRADKNILILKCEDGKSIRVYPSGGYSIDGSSMTDIDGCLRTMDDPMADIIDQGEDMPCDDPEADLGAVVVAEVPDDGFDHMAAPQPPEEAIMGGPASLDNLLRRADDIEIEEEYGDQPRYGQFYTYDELASETARDIQAHSGEDIDEYDTDGCAIDLIGQADCPDGGLPHDHEDTDRSKFDHSSNDEFSETFDFSDFKKKINENAGGSAPTSAPIGTDLFDTEDDIANGMVMMQFEDEGDKDNISKLKEMTKEDMNYILRNVLKDIRWAADKAKTVSLRSLKVDKMLKESPQKIIDEWVDAGAPFPGTEEFFTWSQNYVMDEDGEFETHMRFRREHPDQWEEYVNDYINESRFVF